MGGERTLQCAAFGVGQRRLACLAYCLRACLVAAEVGAVDGVVEDDGVEDAQEIVLAAAVCVAIALDQAAAQRDFQGQRVVCGRAACRGAGDCRDPARDQSLFLAVARRDASQRTQPGEAAQHQEAEHAGGFYVQADVQLVREAVFFGKAQKPPRQRAGQQCRHFLNARFEVFDDVHRLVGLGLHFLAHAFEAAFARFQVGDTDDVLVTHPQRKKAAGLAGQFVLVAIEPQHRFEAVQVEVGVSLVLKVGAPRDAFLEHLVRRCRERSAHAIGWRAAPNGRFQRMSPAGSGRGMVEAGGKTAQAGFGALAHLANRVLAGGARQRQRTRAGQCAEHHRADHRARTRCDLGHVEQDGALGQFAGGVDDLVAVKAAVAHLHFFHRRVDAMVGGDQGGALRGDKAVQHGPASFEQFGGDHDVDVSGCRGKGHHRTAAAQLTVSRRIKFDVIGGGTGALRHARY